MSTDKERARIEAVAVMCEQVVDSIGVCDIFELLLYDVRNFDVCICDKRVEVEPPYPVVFARFYELLGHVELPENDSAVRVRFVLHVEVVAVATGIVYVMSMLGGCL